MRDDFTRRMSQQIVMRTVGDFAKTTNEEADDYKSDNDDCRGAVKIQRERQWQVISLAKAVRPCLVHERTNYQCRRGKKRDHAAGYAPGVRASAAELRPGQWVPREYDRCLTAPGVPERGTFRLRAP